MQTVSLCSPKPNPWSAPLDKEFLEPAHIPWVQDVFNLVTCEHSWHDPSPILPCAPNDIRPGAEPRWAEGNTGR